MAPPASLARFTAVVRAFVPLVAGILKMPPRQFYAANVLSAVVWAPAHVFPGVVLALVAGMTDVIHGQGAILVIAGLIVVTLIGFATHWWFKAKIKVK